MMNEVKTERIPLRNDGGNALEPAALSTVRSEPLLADLRDLKRELEIAVNSQLAGPDGRSAFRSCLGSVNTILDKYDKAQRWGCASAR